MTDPRFLRVSRDGNVGIFVAVEVPNNTYVSQLWVVNGHAWGSLFAVLYRSTDGWLLELDRRLFDAEESLYDRFSVEGDERTALRSVGACLRGLGQQGSPVPTFRAIPVRSARRSQLDMALSLVPDHAFLLPVPCS